MIEHAILEIVRAAIRSWARKKEFKYKSDISMSNHELTLIFWLCDNYMHSITIRGQRVRMYNDSMAFRTIAQNRRTIAQNRRTNTLPISGGAVIPIRDIQKSHISYYHLTCTDFIKQITDYLGTIEAYQ